MGRVASGPLQLKQAFSWLSIGPAISNFLGPLCAGLAIDHAGFRAVFALMALLLLAWLGVRRAVELPEAPAHAGGAGRPRVWDLLGSVQPMVMSMLHQITPHARHGEALGLRLMAINASSVAMPLLFGAAGAAVGVAGMFWAMGALVALGTRTAWRLGRDADVAAQPSR